MIPISRRRSPGLGVKSIGAVLDAIFAPNRTNQISAAQHNAQFQQKSVEKQRNRPDLAILKRGVKASFACEYYVLSHMCNLVRGSWSAYRMTSVYPFSDSGASFVVFLGVQSRPSWVRLGVCRDGLLVGNCTGMVSDPAGSTSRDSPKFGPFSVGLLA